MTFKLDTNLWKDPSFKVTQYGLNRQVARTSVLGWNPVTGIYQRSRKHGYCSKSNWVVQIEESVFRQGDEYGTMHPNVLGQGNYARAIRDAITQNLDE